MATVDVTENNFAQIAQTGIVVLDWWAPWCGPCRAFAPVFKAAAERHDDVVFGKINTELEPGLAATFGIQAIPTIMILRDGVLLVQEAGVMSGGALDRAIAQVRTLDMDEIHRSIAAAEHAEHAQGGA